MFITIISQKSSGGSYISDMSKYLQILRLWNGLTSPGLSEEKKKLIQTYYSLYSLFRIRQSSAYWHNYNEILESKIML